jgi:hypothetical protein
MYRRVGGDAEHEGQAEAISSTGAGRPDDFQGDGDEHGKERHAKRSQDKILTWGNGKLLGRAHESYAAGGNNQSPT